MRKIWQCVTWYSLLFQSCAGYCAVAFHALFHFMCLSGMLVDDCWYDATVLGLLRSSVS